jgi:hypothetical protein
VIPPRPFPIPKDLTSFLLDATLAALRAGSNGDVSARMAINAARTLATDGGVLWNREVKP